MNLLLIDPHHESSELYQDLCKRGIKLKVVSHEQEATEYLRRQDVELIIMRYLLADITGVKLAGYYRKLYPAIPVIIVSEDPDLEKWKQATQVKATFMPLPLDIEKFKYLFLNKIGDKQSSQEKFEIQEETTDDLETFSELNTQVEDNYIKEPLKKTITSDHSKNSQPIQKPTKNFVKKKPKRKRMNDYGNTESTIITIFSPKGGVGKTTTAVNLATLFKTDLELETVILEFTRQTGNVLGHFPLNPNINIRDWVERSQWPTEEELEDMLLWCPTTGVAILPTQPLLDEDVNKAIITPEDVSAIIDCLAPHFDCIVIDGGTVMDQVLFHLLDISDQVVMVSKLERETLQDCHYVPIMLERREIDESKVVHP